MHDFFCGKALHVTRLQIITRWIRGIEGCLELIREPQERDTNRGPTMLLSITWDYIALKPAKEISFFVCQAHCLVNAQFPQPLGYFTSDFANQIHKNLNMYDIETTTHYIYKIVLRHAQHELFSCMCFTVRSKVCNSGSEKRISS